MAGIDTRPGPPAGISEADLQRAGVTSAVVLLGFVGAMLVIARVAPSQHHGAATLILLGAAALGCARLLAWLLVRSVDDLRRRLARSVETAGVVSAVETEWSTGERRVYPTVRFSAAGEARELRTARAQRGYRIAQPVRVRCDPHDATWVVIDDGGLARLERILRLGPALLAVAVAGAGFAVAGVVDLLAV